MRVPWLPAVLTILVTGCGFSSRPLEPLVAGSQQFFDLQWDTTARGPQRLVQGHVRNTSGFAATNVRLLVEGIEPAGRIVDQRLVGIGGQLTPGTRVPFQTAMAAAPSYRVRVFSYDWVQAAEPRGQP